MNVVKYLLITSLATLIPGQLIRIPIGTFGVLTLSDVSVVLTVIIFLTVSINRGIKIKIPYFFLLPIVLFSLSALVSLIMSLNIFSTKQVVSGGLYLVRFLFYTFLFLTTINIVKAQDVYKWIKAILFFGAIFTLIGFIQLIFAPDFSILTQYGWDPHMFRLSSSTLDPNFTGLLLTFFISISISLYFKTQEKKFILFVILFASALVFTFSRSSYLAFLTAIIVIGILRSKKILIVATIFIVISIFLVPKTVQRIKGALTLDDTAKSRIESWENAYEVFSKNYLIGIGFNNYRYAQQQLGRFTFDNPQGGNSGAGVDSSFILVAVTTGLIGLSFYIFLISNLLKYLIRNIKTNYLSSSTFSSLLAFIVHTQFVNSFFYPQIMIYFWIILGLTYVENN